MLSPNLQTPTRRYMRKIAFPSRSQCVSIAAGVINLAIAFPQYLPLLHTWDIEPTLSERKVIGLITVGSMWLGRSLNPTKSGLPGQQSDPTTPTSQASAVADTPSAAAQNAAAAAENSDKGDNNASTSA